MALIKCPECGAQVSSAADSCPKCAYPISGGGSTQAHGGKIQTVEQTSKRYKLQELLSSLLIIGSSIVAMITFSLEDPLSNQVATIGILSILGFLVGIIWFIFVRFLIWWHHG